MLGDAQAGADIEGAHDALQPWSLLILLSGSLLFALGAFSFARAIARNGILNPGMTWLVGTALVVMGSMCFVPPGVFQICVGGVASIIAL